MPWKKESEDDQLKLNYFLFKWNSVKQWVFVTLLIAIFLHFYHQKKENDAATIQKTELSKMNFPPLLGNMAGINLAIPGNEFQGYPYVHYEGRSRDWTIEKFVPATDVQPAYWQWYRSVPVPTGKPGQSHLEREKFNPTQDTPIIDFYASIRVSNFSPVKTKQDLDDFIRGMGFFGDKNEPPIRFQWMNANFFSTLYVQYLESGNNLKLLFERHFSDSETKIGPFSQQQSAYGLSLKSSDQEGDELGINKAYNMFLYDDNNWATFIECRRITIDRYGVTMQCEHYFAIPELKAIAVAKFNATSELLSRWPEIETGVKKLAHSYVKTHPR